MHRSDLVLGSNVMPIVSPILKQARILIVIYTAYRMDLDQLTDDQRGRVIAHLAGAFDVSREEIVPRLATDGVSVLAEDAIVSGCCARLLT